MPAGLTGFHTIYSGGIEPLDFPNIILWLDPADTTTITESGGVVTQMNDKSISGNNATPNGTGPTTGATTKNGNNVLDFVVTRDLFLSSPITAAWTEGTIFLTALKTSSTAGSVWICRTNSFGANYVVQDGGSGARLNLSSTRFASNSDSNTENVWEILTFRWDDSGPTGEVRVNGSSANSSFTAGTSSDFAIQSIGDYSGTTSDAAGSLGDIIIADRHFSDAEVLAMESQYLNPKWDVY